MRTEEILDRLQKVKSCGSGKWQACCPAHEDKSPSLSIKQTDEGSTLLKCWAGCFTADIVAAIGLQMNNLFYESSSIDKSDYKKKQLIRDLKNSQLFVAIYDATALTGEAITREDTEKYIKHKSNEAKILNELRGFK
jgi:hypothetical protein